MSNMLGRVYEPGEDIVREGESGDCMYVLQEGSADIYKRHDGELTKVDTMEAGEVFGEAAIIERTVRTATVRAATQARVMTIDRKTFLRRVQEDPALALNILKVMTARVRRLNREVAELRRQLEPGSGSGAAH